MEDIKDNQKEIKDEQPSPRGAKPLVFISHDTRDAELAEAFSKLLSSVSAGVLKSFRSSDKRGNQGIAYGVEWYPEIMKKLADASDVVALLTQHSVDRPWILYEAGVAKGKLETPLLGVAIGIPLNKANNGPFAQFQNSGDDIDSLTKLVVQLVNRIPNSEPDAAVIKMQVEVFKRQAEEILKRQPEVETNDGQLMEDSSVAKLFEEVKIMFQDLPARIERNVEPSYKRKKFRFHTEMLHELMYISESSEDDFFGILIIISLFRDDMPWVYEIGKETYEVLKSSKAIAAKEKAIMNFEG
ncbi:TIR domain-containing protein [Telluribacter sp. SYSU D00476]|uniref:TIR domain-containing protein n=1 Tax=Telluribacter sp. SYSU D00476 TaxID=2811430 RepID=UPI001FF42A74|nr:TIR domain-containing protein [Telluribacter sp. SYSU D00476]